MFRIKAKIKASFKWTMHLVLELQRIILLKNNSMDILALRTRTIAILFSSLVVQNRILLVYSSNPYKMQITKEQIRVNTASKYMTSRKNWMIKTKLKKVLQVVVFSRSMTRNKTRSSCSPLPRMSLEAKNNPTIVVKIKLKREMVKVIVARVQINKLVISRIFQIN